MAEFINDVDEPVRTEMASDSFLLVNKLKRLREKLGGEKVA
jgi:hypothetical protein